MACRCAGHPDMFQVSGARITNDPLPTVWADETAPVQVFQNLIGNAIKYRGERLRRSMESHDNRSRRSKHFLSRISSSAPVILWLVMC
jgi:signal transduction histidine kinase